MSNTTLFKNEVCHLYKTPKNQYKIKGRCFISREEGIVSPVIKKDDETPSFIFNITDVVFVYDLEDGEGWGRV
jgi:hypothetical protein